MPSIAKASKPKISHWILNLIGFFISLHRYQSAIYSSNNLLKYTTGFVWVTTRNKNVSVLLFFNFGSVFMNGGNPAEEAVYTFGTIIVLFMLFFISQMCYLIDLINKKR
ncbi:hypothetical protein E4O93_07250 [Diaphorobacter sp. DS2]|nr:hypothetical protein E4O93_07250 [Diaphorobacter sp. DS2]